MIDPAVQTVTLGKQLGAAGGLMLVMTVVHALGLTAVSRVLHLRKDHLDAMTFGLRSVLTMSAMGVLLLLLHTLEIGLFAGFYLWVGGAETVEEALYHSASAYATLGHTADYFPTQWRLIAAFEALIGFLLIGWSTGFIFSKVSRLMPD